MYKGFRKNNTPTKKFAVKKDYRLNLSQYELDMLIKLLEFSQMEILRTFKKFSSEDFDLKEIYGEYRFQGNQLRRKFKTIRGVSDYLPHN